MARLLKYFNKLNQKKSETTDAVLPEIDGPLVNVMPSSDIQTANKAICATLLESPHGSETNGGNDNETKHHGNYQFFTPKEKAALGKRAAEYGITSTIRYFVRVDH